MSENEDWTTTKERYQGMNAGPSVSYTTKDSGERVVHETGMQRDTQKGKPRFDLLLPELQEFEETFLYRCAMLLTRGAEKYEPRNWEKAKTGEEYERFRTSVIRHFFQWFCGVNDGEDHAAATFFNIMGAEYVKWRWSKEQ